MEQKNTGLKPVLYLLDQPLLIKALEEAVVEVVTADDPEAMEALVALVATPDDGDAHGVYVFCNACDIFFVQRPTWSYIPTWPYIIRSFSY